MASKVNLAATSEILSAPFVITRKFTSIIIRNIINPTTGLSLATNLPKPSITFPALPSARINLVVDTFKESLNTVAKTRKEGNMDNCSASFKYIVFNRIIADNIILIERRMSSIKSGIGKMNISITATIIIGTDTFLNFIHFYPLSATFHIILI